MKINNLLLFFLLAAIISCNKKTDEKPTGSIQILAVKAGTISLQPAANNPNINVYTGFNIQFSAPIDTLSAAAAIQLFDPASNPSELAFNWSTDMKTLDLIPINQLQYQSQYHLEISDLLKGANKESFPGVSFNFETEAPKIELISLTLNGKDILNTSIAKNISYDSLFLVARFSDPLSNFNPGQHITITPLTTFETILSEDKTTISIRNLENLDYYRKYFISLSSSIQSENGAVFEGYSKQFITGLNPEPKFPMLDDESLLDLVQQQTLRYFWDFAHPVSGLARERNSSGDVVTIGGSGFGLMAIIAGVERGWINRQEAVTHYEKVTSFLENADRFHGVWPHWLNGITGNVHPFSANDDGADLVETSFMAAALITVRQYLDPQIPEEATVINRINVLLGGIEWDWFTRGGQNVLFWHWSPNNGWAMNMQVRGYNEALITYFMAATSENHAITADVYHQGWANNGGIINGKSFYDIELPLGFDFGGPLFFSHYSFLGLDPRNLSDQYADYWQQNQNHSLINREHCVRNPRNHTGYSADCWGLTASDEPSGYGVHEPTRDNGTISPTAALSSMPFTPEYSMQAMRHFYFILGDKLWGEFGFKDAFNPSEAWWANSYLAIDQGPIIVMIENHRSGLLWDLFMSAPEVKQGLTKLGFNSRK